MRKCNVAYSSRFKSYIQLEADCRSLGESWITTNVVWQIFTSASVDKLPPSSGHNTHFMGHSLAGSFGVKSCLWNTFYPPSILILLQTYPSTFNSIFQTTDFKDVLLIQLNAFLISSIRPTYPVRHNICFVGYHC